MSEFSPDRYSSRYRLLLPVLSILTDLAVIIIGGLFAFYIRFHPLVLRWFPAAELSPRRGFYFGLVVVIGVTSVLLFLLRGLYRYPMGRLVDEWGKVLINFLFVHALVLASVFFYRGFSYSRLTVGLGLLFGGVLLILSRTFWRFVRQQTNRTGLTAKRTGLVIEEDLPQSVVRVLPFFHRYGLSVVGYLQERPFNIPQDKGEVSSPLEIPYLGDIGQAREIIKNHRLEVLVVITADEKKLRILIKNLYGLNVEFYWLPDPMFISGLPRRLVEIGGLPFWVIKEVPLKGWGGVVKRVFDLVGAALLLILFAPFFILIALLIKLTSPGPIFYLQDRVGMDGKVFKCYKFRSMRINAEAEGRPGWTRPGDPRVTPIGRILRRLSLDELPQLLNVLKGEMSLVGPRPERPEWVALFAEKWEDYHERHRVKAGITGWAQVNGLRGDSSIEERLKFDRYYVENWSIWLDIKILLLTIIAVLRGENAY